MCLGTSYTGPKSSPSASLLSPECGLWIQTRDNSARPPAKGILDTPSRILETTLIAKVSGQLGSLFAFALIWVCASLFTLMASDGPGIPS